MNVDDTKKPEALNLPAEVVGSFEDVLRVGNCTDGRRLYSISLGAAFDGEEIFVLAPTEHQAAHAVLRNYDTHITEVTKHNLWERTREECLKVIDDLDRLNPACGICTGPPEGAKRRQNKKHSSYYGSMHPDSHVVKK